MRFFDRSYATAYAMVYALVYVIAMMLFTGFSLSLMAQTSAPNVSVSAPVTNIAVRGKRVFNLQCRACHSLEAGEAHKVGPNLYGTLTRPAGTAAAFKYSVPLKAAAIQWNAQTLDQWLTKPSAMVSGTTMAFEGLASESDRAAVVAYLLEAEMVAKVK